ncbi:putative ATP-dependent RNA helicase DDX43 [Bienertia sinuspersici]
MATSTEKNKIGKGCRPINYAIVPLWKYTDCGNTIDGGGNRKWICNFCDKKVTSSYSKLKAHLLQIRGKGVGICEKVTDDIKEQMQKEEEEAENKRLNAKEEAQLKSDYLSLPSESDLKQQKKRKGNHSDSSLVRAFKAKDRDDLDKQCARMFYSAGLPFNFARNPYFRSFCTNLANSQLQGDTWKKKGVSICSDGWSDGAGRPIINIMAASGTSAVFIDSIDASGMRKDAAYVSEFFIKGIEEVGAENVVQVVTDNGPNFKAAGTTLFLKSSSFIHLICQK